MDANGTRYQLLLGQDDWATCLEGNAFLSTAWSALDSPSSPAGTNFYWDPKRHQLTLWPQLFAFPRSSDDKALLPSDRRGATADRFGSIYFLDPTRTQVLVISAGDQTLAPFWPSASPPAPAPRAGAFGALAPPAVPTPRVLSALAVTQHHYLVVGATDPSALLIFDLYRNGPPRILLWPPDVPFAPFDMAPAPGGGVFILDSDNKRYWSLDANFAVCGRDQGSVLMGSVPQPSFRSLAGSPPYADPEREFPQGHLLDATSPLSSIQPVAIESLPDGTVLILDLGDGETSYIERYRSSTRLDGPLPVDVIAKLLPQGTTMAFTAQDLAFVPTPTPTDPLAGQVLVALASGNQSLAFDASSARGGGLRLLPLPDYYPMRRFGGRAVFCANGTPYYDFTDRFIPLVMQKRPQYVTSGTIVTPVLDGGIPGCVWHRLILDAAMPLDTNIQVESRAADDPQTLSETPFLSEPPRLYARTEGTELPFATLSAGLTSWELLFQEARGRYLQLQITLTGNARSSPRIRALRAYYPRFSYVKQYMPATYTDNDSLGLLDRFMANFEGVLTPIEDRIAAIQELFDSRTAPSDTLEWLAAWFGVSMDPAWDDVRQRLFVRHAMDLFQWRGTVRGIQMVLDLVLSPDPCDAIFTSTGNPRPSGSRIVEQYSTRITPAVFANASLAASLFGPPPGPNAWAPSQGGDALVALWQLAAAAAGLPAQTTFPVTPPADAATAATWTAFAKSTLGFVPASPTTIDPSRWTQFLQRRYPSLATLNAAYGTSYARLTDVALPTSLPPDGNPLLDWLQLQGIALPIAQSAHRFRVLLPLPPGISADLPQQRQQLDLVTRLVELEKPAHTIFDVRFYWAMFQIGQARLGYDTLLDQGSRIPQLSPSMVLGYGYLLEGHLAPGFPQDATNRDVAGRDPLGLGSNA